MSKSKKKDLVKLKKGSFKEHAKEEVHEGLIRNPRQDCSGEKVDTSMKDDDEVDLKITQGEDKSLDVESAAVGENLSDKCMKILEELASIKNASEARQYLHKEVEAGKIEISDVMVLMQKWRQRKRKMAYEKCKEKVVEMEGTLEDVKRTVRDLVRTRKLHRRDAGDIIKRWKNAERRRVKRQIARQTNKACFNCRQVGHMLADCPNRGGDEEVVGNTSSTCNDGICFKCGSTEHSVRKCPRKHVKGFPFAACFVCGQQGHLSRDCEKNANGIYPDGGCCSTCGSKKHLKRECPELAAQKQKDNRNVSVRTMSAMSSVEEDDVPEEDASAKMSKQPKKKIVKF